MFILVALAGAAIRKQVPLRVQTRAQVHVRHATT